MWICTIHEENHIEPIFKKKKKRKKKKNKNKNKKIRIRIRIRIIKKKKLEWIEIPNDSKLQTIDKYAFSIQKLRASYFY